MITREGRADIREHVRTTFVYAQIGTGGDSTNPNATDLDSPLEPSAGNRENIGSGTASGETSVDWKFTILGSNYVGHTIKEVGIFDANTAGNMLLRVSYDGIGPLTATDEIEFIITVEVD